MKDYKVVKTHPVSNLDAETVGCVATTIRQLLVNDLKDHPSRMYPKDISTFFIDSQNRDLLKKFANDGGNDETRRQLAYDKFLQTNEHMSKYTGLSFPETPHRFGDLSDIDKMLLRARSLCHEIMTPIEEDEFILSCGNSSGVSIGVPFADTSNERKFTFPISISQNALPLFRWYMSKDPSLAQAIEIFNGQHTVCKVFSIEESSRATTVPKTNKIDRMIAIEPTGNMFLQQGFMKVMYDRLKVFGLNVATLPDRHVSLAKRASIDGINSTIDFSSASDCLSISLLRYLLPGPWFSLLDSVRMPSMSINDKQVQLNMFSTMGNADTFPLETLVFYCLGVAALSLQTPSTSLLVNYKDKKRVSVFGDDCILPFSCSASFMEVCTHVGFKVNHEKSFFDGEPGFRESCGGDFLHGFEVSTFKLKVPSSERRSALEPWLYTILNLVIEKYIMYFGSTTYVYDKGVLRYLFSLFRRNKLCVKFIPPDFPSDAGLFSSDAERLRRCYDFELSNIREDVHGSKSFLFCRFSYRAKTRLDPGIQYALALKRLQRRNSPCKPARKVVLDRRWTSLRRIGGYHVARSEHGHWPWDTHS